MSAERIPFKIDTGRVIELLGKQLYQSPLALLRENTQNAYDALLMRRCREESFEPKIEITITPDEVSVADNGVGMTADDLRNHFWFAGSSSKNNDEARAAGVVGTFGIGAMANFGIAGELVVETESALSGVRTRSWALRNKLTLNHDCIDLETMPSQGVPGTKVTARVLPANRINVSEATNYIADFISLLGIPVTVNGTILSGQTVEKFVPNLAATWSDERAACVIGPRMTADVRISISQNAEVWIEFREIVWSQEKLRGRITLRSGTSALRTCRSGFGLATVAVGSIFQFGGVADLLLLQPTAGREALTTDSMQLLQSLMAEVDSFASMTIAARPESDSSTPFMNWVVAHRRYDLCRNLHMMLHPGNSLSLGDIEQQTATRPLLLYLGNDAGAIARNGSEERPLLVLARSNPRRQCEAEFLKNYCKTEAVSDNPKVERPKPNSDLSTAERALSFRIESILETDYFLKTRLSFGEISHSLPFFVARVGDLVEITLDPKGQTVILILGLFESEYAAFGSMVKDFVRTTLFSRISEYVPSSTTKGAAAFLKMLRAKGREVFEYEDSDHRSFSSIWEDYAEGKISMEQAVQQSMVTMRSSVQIVESAGSVGEVVPDVIQNEQAIAQRDPSELTLDAAPAITRIEKSCPAKLLTIPDIEPALRGYRCFLAITDKVRDEIGEFFLQPHKTSIVWGGQRALFIFIHHSGNFGLYYDLQTRETIAAGTGGVQTPTCTLVLKDRIYIPVPNLIVASFVPQPGEKKRFEVRGEIHRTESRNPGPL